MAEPKKKRETWHDRKCHCGERVKFRVQYDIAHCHRMECWDKALATLGLQRIPKPESK